MISLDFSFQAGAETLCATKDIPTPEVLPTALSLHGAGPSNRVRATYLGTMMAENGLGFLRFDFSGHGDSTGHMEKSSLTKRLTEAEASLTFIDNQRPKILIGTSMGGHVALRLSRKICPEFLILFCPAIYAAEAEDIPFGQGFTDIIRRPDSFRNSPAIEDLKHFKGHLLMFMGDKDDIIPLEVPTLIQNAAIHTKSTQFVTLADCPHPIHAWAEKNPEGQFHILSTVQQFCRL